MTIYIVQAVDAECAEHGNDFQPIGYYQSKGSADKIVEDINNEPKTFSDYGSFITANFQYESAMVEEVEVKP